MLLFTDDPFHGLLQVEATLHARLVDLALFEVRPRVLSRPSREDFGQIEESIGRALKLLPQIVAGDSQKVMNTLHSGR